MQFLRERLWKLLHNILAVMRRYDAICALAQPLRAAAQRCAAPRGYRFLSGEFSNPRTRSGRGTGPTAPSKKSSACRTAGMILPLLADRSAGTNYPAALSYAETRNPRALPKAG